MKTTTRLLLIAAVLGGTFTITARADEIDDWNQIMFQAAIPPATSPATSPLVMTRVAAIVQVSVYDSVAGIEGHFRPVHSTLVAPPGASRRAAAVQAAYASLVRLYPSLTTTFDARRAASLEAIASGPAAEHSGSIALGIAFGQAVADDIWAWRSTDHFAPPPPPFLGDLFPFTAGRWRRTPPGFLPGAGPQFAYMTPWAITSPGQFHPPGPPALGSQQYTTEFNETKTMGRFDSLSRTPDQTLYSLFWNASSVSFSWNRVALILAEERQLTFSKKARLLALLNVAVADAAIGCWEAKYSYLFWRPVTAIPEAGTDGNPDTIADATWAPLFATPAHPEYPSGHSCNSGAAAEVLSKYFGEDTAFTADSDIMLGVTRSFPNFSSALEEIKNARIFAGIHFRAACNDGQALGVSVADYVLANSSQPVNGKRVGQLSGF
jgi:hypothetical protein